MLGRDSGSSAQQHVIISCQNREHLSATSGLKGGFCKF